MRIDMRDLEKFIYDMGVNVMTLTSTEKTRLLTPLKNRVLKHIRTNAENMLKGRYFLKEVRKSVYLDSRHIYDENPYYLVNFRGMLYKLRNGKPLGGPERAAAVAFMNEYGVPTKNAQKRPRPFIKEAIYKGTIESYEEIADILGQIVANKITK